MFITKKHVSRRTVLKGVGATIALPLLDAMNPAATAWAQTAAGSTPKRFAFVGFPHGAIMDRWSPAQTGTDYEMSPILQPLEPFREHLTIVSGLRNKPGETPEPHGYIEMTWLTLREAVGPRRRPARTPASAPTSSRRGTSVRTRGCRRSSSRTALARRAASRGARRRSRCRRKAIRARCSRSCSARATPTRSARRFSTRPAASSTASRGRRRGCRPASASRDRVVVSDYLDSVREIERRVQMASQQDTSRAGDSGCAGRHAERHHRAFQADVRSDGARVPGGHHARHHVLDGSRSEHADVHQPRHRRSVPSAVASREQSRRSRTKLVQIQRYHTEVFAKFIERLAKAQEGDGTVLDHSTILYGSNMSNSDRHNNDPLPAAILGHAHGRIKGGQHVKYPQDSRFADLLVTLFDRNNIPVEKIGDSGGILSEV